VALPDPDAYSRARSAREFLADLGPPLALAAVLLPFAGVVVRWIAFSFAQTVKFPLDLALEAPTGDLVAIGLNSLFPGLLALPLVAMYDFFAPFQYHDEKARLLDQQYEEISPKLGAVIGELKALSESAEPIDEIPTALKAQTDRLIAEVDRLNVEKERLEKQRPKDLPAFPRKVESALGPIAKVLTTITSHRRTMRVLGVVYWGGLILFMPWPISLTFVSSLLLVSILPLIARRTGRVALSQVWPLVVVALAIAALASGLYGDFVGNEAGNYHFAADAQLADGRYAQIGEANSRTILMACSPLTPTVISVADSNIIAVGIDRSKVQPTPFPWPTMFGALIGHGSTLGYRSPC
jgi:hypothetical protein